MNDQDFYEDAIDELEKLILFHREILDSLITEYKNKGKFLAYFDLMNSIDPGIKSAVESKVFDEIYDEILEEATTIELLRVMKYKVISAKKIFGNEAKVKFYYSEEDYILNVEISGILKDSYPSLEGWMKELYNLKRFYELTLKLYLEDLVNSNYFNEIDPNGEFSLTSTTLYWIEDLIRNLRDVDKVIFSVNSAVDKGIKIGSYGFDENGKPYVIFKENNNEERIKEFDRSYF